MTPSSALTDADRAALKEHKEELMDALWQEDGTPAGRPLAWPHDHPQWNGTGWSWTPMTVTDGYTPEVEDV